MYKAAIIGIGQIGYKIDHDPTRNFIWSHCKAFNSHQNIELVAISDTNNELCEDFNKEYSLVRSYNSYLRMLDEQEIELLSICVPSILHLKIVSEVIEYSSIKAIFIEKPVGNSLDDSLQIEKICEQKKIVLASNYMRRWDNKYKYVKHLIDTHKLGKLQTIAAYGATSMLTSSSHLIDLLLFFGGKTSWVFGELQKDYVRKVSDIEDHGGVSLIKFENESFGFLKATSKNDNNFMFELDVLLEDGRITISESWDDDDQSLLKVMEFQQRNSDPNGKYKTLKKMSDTSQIVSNERMIDAISDIIQCIEKGSFSPLSNGKTAIEVHKIIRDIKKSSVSQQSILPQ